MLTTLTRAAEIHSANVADYRKMGFDRKSARRIAYDKLVLSITAETMYESDCSLEVAECRAADLAQTILAYERQPAGDNADDPLLGWLRGQMSEPSL